MNATPRQLMETYLLEVVSKGRLELIEKLAHAHMIDEANQAFGGPPGREGLIAHVRGFRRAVGDLNITINRIVAGDEEVMAWWIFTGQHVGPWLGEAPSGKDISGTVFSFFELDNRRIWRYRLWLHAILDVPIIFDSTRPFNLGE